MTKPFVASEPDEAEIGRRQMRANSLKPVEKPPESPYAQVDLMDVESLAARTRDLINDYPIAPSDVVDIVLDSWSDLFESQIGPARIGRDVFPSPQILGSFMHELIPLKMREVLGNDWRSDQAAKEKDIVYIPDDTYSTEVKTSSSAQQIFANRSFGQPGSDNEKKSKTGYYLGINFESWERDDDGAPLRPQRPDVTLVRLGWLDHTDWYSQVASTGQAASLPPVIESGQLLTIYRKA